MVMKSVLLAPVSVVFAEIFDLLLGGRRANKHAVAASAVNFFHHQVFEVGQGVFQVISVATHVGRHIFENRFFAEIKLDHLGHIGVDRFVVGHARANRVAQRHVASAIHIEQPSATQGGIRSEGQRIEEIVVNPAVDHIHTLGATRGAHVNEVVFDKQVLSLHQLHTHLLREKGVLEIGAVVHARCEHHHGGFIGR